MAVHRSESPNRCFQRFRLLAGLIDYSQLIPVFPLPNVVLFPKAVVPLHVFEPRYRNMMADALCGSRLIAIAHPDFREELDRAAHVITQRGF